VDSLKLSQNDMIHHVVKFGIDIYPQVEIPKERTRLNIFYEEARRRFGQLCDQLVASDTEFRISKEFRGDTEPGPGQLRVNTFVLTSRGPVFVFPLRLPAPIGETGLEASMIDSFKSLKELFFSALAERQLMKVGMVRDMMFDVGQTSCESVLSERREFAGATLRDGQCLLGYRDERCNIRLKLEPVQVMKTTRLPVGAEVTERQSFGLRVELDVNNVDVKPLDDAEIDLVIERASGLWPDELLKSL